MNGPFQTVFFELVLLATTTTRTRPLCSGVIDERTVVPALVFDSLASITFPVSSRSSIE